MDFLSNAVKLTKISDPTGAGTSAITSAAVDMAGYDGALFFTSFGTAAANNVITLQQSSDDGSSDSYGDILGTSVSAGTSDEDVWVDIMRPGKRYLKAIVTPATSSTVGDIWVLQYGPVSKPVDNTTSGTMAGEQHIGPAEGTA